VVGAWCSVGAPQRAHELLRSRGAIGFAVAYLVLSFLVVMTWYFPRYAALIPKVVQDWMYPIDKNNLDLLRFLHFAALAILTVRFISDRLAGAEVAVVAPDDHVRAALAGDFLLRNFPLLHRSLRDLGDFPIGGNADINQCVRYLCHDRGGSTHYVVQHD